MVAYSFKGMFADPILMGGKTQTIRAHRKRHARSGEELQLYTGMRTKKCRLLGRATCTVATSIELVFGSHPYFDIPKFGRYEGEALNTFARNDGFEHWAQLAAFWRLNHGRIERFEGTIIYWKDLIPA